jgi:diadenosine tetraphosphatase ApaH/serine/threonine PP2A family protein phosphatase
MSRTLFVGDVHSCAHELGSLFELTRPTRVILVGDVFNKGPDPAGTWALIQQWAVESVLGNHDVAVIEKADRGDTQVPAAAIRWLRELPLTLGTDEWIVVHGGLNPTGGKTTKEQCINMRRWPDESNSSNPFWWQLYGGNRLVLYGHDAVRGLQDHRPRTLGLDTGCVYGGALTGYLLEEDRLISVPASKAYLPI